MSHAHLRPALLAAAIALACLASAQAATSGAPTGSPTASAPSIAWQDAANDADVERAFTTARSQHKPVLLYWGASWCPPCNQLKATLFNRQDFIERSRAFVAVHVDGDLPGAQKLGTRFKVRGYPTMILFNTDGQEITRLPGEVDAPQVMAVLQLGLANGRPMKAVLADARAGKPLTGNEWRLLAFYSWDTDEQQLVPRADRPALLNKLAAACPANDTDTATRLKLKALAEDDDPKAPAAPKTDAASRDRVMALLADPSASRAQMDVLTNQATDIVKALAGADMAERDRLIKAFDMALQRLQADTTLSRADRSTAVLARIELVRLQNGVAEKAVVKPATLPAGLLKDARDQAARDDREITDGFERQSVITTDAYTLERAGLDADSDALLKASLSKSHSPYYLMSELASNAKARGDKTGALHWYQEAFDKSEGPATRLQWGSSYVTELIELSPQDAPRIEKAVDQLWSEAAGQSNAFYERSARSLQRVGEKLQAWNAGGQHTPVMQRLQTRLDAVCGKLDAADPQRATCDALLKTPPKKA